MNLAQQRKALAQDALRNGDLTRAGAYANLILAADPLDVEAQRLLRDVAQRIGFPAAFDPAAATLADGNRFLLIKAWGAGFWSDVVQVLGALLLAEITGRIPVVHWGATSLYGPGTENDVWTDFFKPVSDVTFDALCTVGGEPLYPDSWNAVGLAWSKPRITQTPLSFTHSPLSYLARTEQIVVFDSFVSVPDLVRWIPLSHPWHGGSAEAILRALIKKYLHPQERIAAACDAFAAEFLPRKPVVAVHLRSVVKTLEFQCHRQLNEEIIAQIRQLPSDATVFLLTDSEEYLKRVCDSFKGAVVTTQAQRTQWGEVHLMQNGRETTIGREIMTDTYLALRADYFVGSGVSNVAGMIALLKDWAANRCLLVSQPTISQPTPIEGLSTADEVTKLFGTLTYAEFTPLKFV